MGRDVTFLLKSDREISPPKRHGMLHDPSGETWPRCSLLVAHFEQGWKESKAPDGRNYFGRNAVVWEGEAELPPKDISKWKTVGELKTIFYDRAGTKHPGYFRHMFHKPRGLWRLLFLVKRSAANGPVVLSRYGRNTYRIDLPDGCVVDDRGIALP
jgi:hypothetical protein